MNTHHSLFESVAMDNNLSLLRCAYVLLLILPSTEQTFRASTGGVARTRAPSDFGARYDLLSRRKQRVPRLPSPVEEAQDKDGYFSGTFDQIDAEHLQLRRGFGGFGGFRRRHRKFNRDKTQVYGQFNSDTYGCRGIQTRSCTAYTDCAGCLGLYTCDASRGTCNLKGLSRQTDGFFQSLQDT
ncbi:hypothetical protein MATL_G00259870 [Megalops atlanticus]|uniref:Uncharacterized protein n=1 Tax=Megalops atlanticus TaxID=7932 RepID=A0A9D3SVP9_MEGAT|nr:hypothetical protein MATL_G00259870 [Megalops atlanticus]